MFFLILYFFDTLFSIFLQQLGYYYIDEPVSFVLSYQVLFTIVLLYTAIFSFQKNSFYLNRINNFYKLLVFFFILVLTQIFFHSIKNILLHYFNGLLLIIIVSESIFHNTNLKKYILRFINLIFICEFLYLLYYIFFQGGISLTFRETRFNLLYGNANEDAGFILFSMPLIAYQIKKRSIRICFYMLIFIYLLLLNGSRYAIIGFIVILSVQYLFENSFTSGILKLSMILIIIISLFLPLIQEAFFTDAFFLNTKDVLNNGYQEGDLSGRISGIWLPAINYTTQHSFLFGFGKWSAINYNFVINEYGTSTQRTPHNLFVFQFVENGFVGLLFFVLFYYYSIKIAIKSIFNDQTKKFGIPLLLSWIGLLFWFMFANAWAPLTWPLSILLFILTFSNHYSYEDFAKKNNQNVKE